MAEQSVDGSHRETRTGIENTQQTASSIRKLFFFFFFKNHEKNLFK